MFTNLCIDLSYFGFLWILYCIETLIYINILLLVFYNFSFIPFAYLIFFSIKPSTGFAFISLYNIIISTNALFLISYRNYYIPDFTFNILLSELIFILCPKTLFLSAIHVFGQSYGAMRLPTQHDVNPVKIKLVFKMDFSKGVGLWKRCLITFLSFLDCSLTLFLGQNQKWNFN